MKTYLWFLVMVLGLVGPAVAKGSPAPAAMAAMIEIQQAARGAQQASQQPDSPMKKKAYDLVHVAFDKIAAAPDFDTNSSDAAIRSYAIIQQTARRMNAGSPESRKIAHDEMVKLLMPIVVGPDIAALP